MKRISFKDRNGLNLTQMVLTGRKTMTRRSTRMYEIGDVVAIQQSYKEIASKRDEALIALDLYKIGNSLLTMDEMGAGWNNKMFVCADLMPHHIRITALRQEQLQAISDDDCLREGITWAIPSDKIYQYPDSIVSFKTPREAFASLIDKVSGRGTWERNPIVWVYEFELMD